MTHTTPNDTTRDPADDPRLTAYALGELAGDAHASDRAAVEAVLARDPAARAFVDETRALGVALRDEYLSAPAASMSDAQRATVMARAAAPSQGVAPKGQVLRVSNWSVPAGIAAALLVGTAFSYRHEIGGWWTGGRDVAQSSPGGMRYTHERPRDLLAADEGDDGARGAAQRAGERRAERDTNAPKPPSARPSTASGASMPAMPAGGPPQAAPVVPPAPPRVPEPPKGGSGGPGGASGPAPAPTPPGFEGGISAGGGGGGGGDGHRVGGVGKNGGGPGSGGERKKVPGLLLADSAEAGEELKRMEALGYVGSEDLKKRLHDDMAMRYATGTGGLIERTLPRAPGTESYAAFADNPFRRVIDAPLSTFGVDVDTASYANVRRFLMNGQLPPPQAVRIEEMVNYFPYRYAAPTDGSAFAANVEVAGCPWDATHRLVRVALKGRVEDMRERPAANLVFLVDVSGSMQPDNKLPLLVRSMKQLVPSLGERDRVSIVTYAGEAGVALQPTRGDQKDTILAALDALRAGGSTNGAAGIATAYQLAQQGFIQGGVNRVILATDGDFNVGVSDDQSLVRIIEEKARSKVFLSVLGFGEGNLQDAKMEGLADKGNGNYAYIDSLREGRKVLVDEVAGTLITIAKDVKLQIEFNPLRVAEYRLIGYENRTLAAADFANDTKDAGDLGAGHAVTALYEVLPTASADAAGQALRYQRNVETTTAAHSEELLVVKLRWKLPEGDVSTYREIPVVDSGASYAKASGDFKFAAAVASFGMLLRGSPFRGQASLDAAMELATDGLDFDPNGLRAEFIDLVRKAKSLR